MKLSSVSIAVLSLFLSLAAIPNFVLAQFNPYPPYVKPQIKPWERQRIVTVPEKRYKPHGNLVYGHEPNWPDMIIMNGWRSSAGRVVAIRLMSQPTKEEGIHFVVVQTRESIVGFGVGQRPIDYLKANDYKVINLVDKLDKPYVVRKDGRTYTLLKNSSKGDKVLDLFNKWWYDYQLPYSIHHTVPRQPFTDEELYDVLDLDFPDDWCWSDKDPPPDKLLG